ncbi:Uncharacterised protein [Serratia rubidaea]|uniref:Uncharacterized protein n=1 Tax=Serratia rubidaea TaxID=61652 RepID=A0A4U9HVR9_SERRU|nr:Uncharacterised protein [Serratia rubidaea]
MVVPEDKDHCRVFFWRIRKVKDWQRDLWRFMYRNRLEALHWDVLEQDRIVLENMAPNARSANTSISTTSACRVCAV